MQARYVLVMIAPASDRSEGPYVQDELYWEGYLGAPPHPGDTMYFRPVGIGDGSATLAEPNPAGDSVSFAVREVTWIEEEQVCRAEGGHVYDSLDQMAAGKQLLHDRYGSLSWDEW